MINYAQLVWDGTPSNGIDEVQRVTITGTPAGGTFTLTYGGQTTAAIPYNATALQVQAALGALSSIGSGNVACSGGPLPATAVDVAFQGALGGKDLSAMTASATGLTGGTAPAVAITSPTAGVRGTYRGAQAGAILLAKNADSAGVIYENTGSRWAPVWAERTADVE